MKTAVGLDIGWKEVKAVELTEDFQARRFGRIEIPRPIDGDEDEIYVAKIRELFKNEKLSKDNVIISLRGFPIIARTYLPPSESKDDFEKWFVDSIQSLIPGTSIADVVYDYQFLDAGHVLISFAKLVSIENRIKMLRACDIIPAAIDASSLALHHAFENHPFVKEKKNFAILDIGGYSTDLLIIKEGRPYIATEILFGTKDLRNEGEDKLFGGVLAHSLKNILNFYRTKEKLEIEDLVLVGIYPDVSGLMNSFRDEIGINVEIGDPFKSGDIKLPVEFNPEDSHHYAHALGLAIKGLISQKGINLMPIEAKEMYQAWHLKKQMKSFFEKSTVISSIVFVVLLFMLYTVINANHKIGGEVNNLKAKISELSYVNEAEKELNAKLQKLRQLGREPFLWSKMLHNIGTAVPEAINLKAISTETRLTTAGGGPEKKTKVVIEGDARDNETVLVFLENLEKYYQHIAVNKMKEEARCEFEISLMR